MRKILILMGRYLPGHRDGGPLRTMANVTEALGDEYEFFIGCLDRDHGDTQAYPGIRRDAWNQVGKARVWYVAPGGFTKELLLRLAEGKDLIYLCGFYEDYGYRTLLLKRRGQISQPVFLASMGVFSKGALSRKSCKKKAFIAACRGLGLFRHVTWSVTSEMEAEDVKRVIGRNIRYIVAEDLPRSHVPGYTGKSSKVMRVAFLSRICPQKNLLRAIEEMQRTKQSMRFTIYGPVEDRAYWRRCQRALQGLPGNVGWEYAGDVPTEDVQRTLAQHDVLFFPTLGENYGHVIFEALSVGCIPVISDQTPWHRIRDCGAGVELPLDADFAAELDRLAEMTDRAAMAEKAVLLAKACVERNRRETGYRTIFGAQGVGMDA